MRRLRDIRREFRAEPTAMLLGMKLLELRPKRAKVRLRMRRDFLTGQHGVLMGGITGVLADLAGVYAALTLINDDQDAVLQQIQDGRFLRPVPYEATTFFADAVISDSAALVDGVDHHGRMRGLITAAVTVSDLHNEPKATFILVFAVMPHALLQERITQARESYRKTPARSKNKEA